MSNSHFIHQPVAGDNEARRAQAQRKRQALEDLPGLAEGEAPPKER